MYRIHNKFIHPPETSLFVISDEIMNAKYFKKIENTNLIQPEPAKFGIRMLIGPFTAIFIIIGCIILIFYPIDKKKYKEIQERIKEMEEKEQLS